MAKYVTRIEADKKLCPVLLSNGNLLEEGDLDDNRWSPAPPPPDILSDLHCSDDSGTTGTSFVLCGSFCAQSVKQQERHIAGHVTCLTLVFHALPNWHFFASSAQVLQPHSTHRHQLSSYHHDAVLTGLHAETIHRKIQLSC